MIRPDVEGALSRRDSDMQRIGNILSKAESSSGTAALVAIDLDGISEIVVELGTEGATAALDRLGQSMSAALPDGYDCWFSRTDHIWIAMPNPPSAAGAEAYTLRALQEISSTPDFGRSATSVTGVAGIALFPGHGENPFKLAEAAQAALKVAHFEQRQVVRADTNLVSDHAFKRWIQSEFPSAIESGQISFVYQPIVNLETNQIAKLEVLARWHHPEKGAIGPGTFVPHIESTQFGDHLFNESLTTASKDQRSWTINGLDAISAVNVSAINLERWDLADHILAATEQWGISPDKFSIEITETALIQNGRRARASLTELAASGMTISLDDFGTGYSSLSQISDYPVSNVKIDRSITSRLVSSKKHRGIVKALLVMGEESDFSVTAEGVETEADATVATDLGCKFAQGYVFARPMPVESVLDLPAELTASS